MAAIAAAVDVPVQTGGGVRDDAAADALLGAGVRRVVVGTAALADPGWVRRLAARHAGRVAVGLDARGRDVAVHGWTEGSGRDLVDVARSFDDAGVAALVVTEIGRDGTLAGPDVDQLVGGAGGHAARRRRVGRRRDARPRAHARRPRRSAGRRLAGVIVGKALYEGAFAVTDAVEVTARA